MRFWCVVPFGTTHFFILGGKEMEEKLIIQGERSFFKSFKVIILIALTILIIGLIFILIVSPALKNQALNEKSEVSYDEWGFEYVVRENPLIAQFRQAASVFFSLGIVFCCISGLGCITLIIIGFATSKMEINVTDKRVYGITKFGKQIDLPLDSIFTVGTGIWNGINVATFSGITHFLTISNNKEICEAISKLLLERQEKGTITYAHQEQIQNNYDSQSNSIEQQKSSGEKPKSKKLIKTIIVPEEQTKKTTIASNLFYSTIDIYFNKVVGSGNQTMTWFFKDYNGIDFVKANMNSQFSQIVFLTGFNSKSRFTGVDFSSAQNRNAMNDTNRILFCSGMFSFEKTNIFAQGVYNELKKAFDNYQEYAEELEESKGQGAISAADELKKFKELLDMGVITQEEFDAKKKQLLGL